MSPSPELRALRLWHWREFTQARKNEEECIGWLYKSINHDKAVFHSGAVQALNDCFDLFDTAEKDNARD